MIVPYYPVGDAIFARYKFVLHHALPYLALDHLSQIDIYRYIKLVACMQVYFAPYFCTKYGAITLYHSESR